MTTVRDRLGGLKIGGLAAPPGGHEQTGAVHRDPQDPPPRPPAPDAANGYPPLVGDGLGDAGGAFEGELDGDGDGFAVDPLEPVDPVPLLVFASACSTSCWACFCAWA